MSLGEFPSLDGWNLPQTDYAEDPEFGMAVSFTPDQWELVSQALKKIRAEAGPPAITDGRALELMAADYLAGP